MPRISLIGLAALLAACGQTGPLYLPDAGIETPVEVRGPAVAVPTAPETPAAADGAAAPRTEEEEPPGPIAP